MDIKKKKQHVEISHTVRTSTNKRVTIKNLTRGMAIKLQCTECLGWEDHPTTCASPLCPLFPFRAKTLKAYDGRMKDNE